MAVKRNFYQRTIIDSLSKMNKGSLDLLLPDGELLKIGDEAGEIKAKITIKNNNFFKRCVLFGDIGFGESYVEGEWETDDITNVIKWVILNIENAPSVSGTSVKGIALNFLRMFNKLQHSKRMNSLVRAQKNVAEHYDLNNDFFALFLDPSMTYSSAYFKEENMTLEQAQFAKYERLCKQLHLKPEDHVLEIGSGWGSNAIYIAKNYGCNVTTVTISEEQYKLANERVKQENLSDKIKVMFKDYRLIEGKFDKIISIEMLEAVGAEFFETYFKKCSDALTKNGILAFQVITCPDTRFNSLRSGVDWIQKHIFPGTLLPSVGAINNAINNTGDLTLVDSKDLGLDYARTLSTWFQEFNKNVSEVKKLGFDDRFIRKWNYYLCYSEAAFAMRNINVMQMVYTRPNNTIR